MTYYVERRPQPVNGAANAALMGKRPQFPASGVFFKSTGSLLARKRSNIRCERTCNGAGGKLKGRTMMLGLSLSAFTTLHVIISLIAIAAGLVVFYG